MNELIGGFLSNESSFGRTMTKIGIIVGANLMFVFFSLPVVTIGASYVALYHVMLKTLRGDGVLNPFVQFWKGFRSNFKQGMIVGILAIVLAIFFYMDFQIVAQMSGGIAMIRYALWVLVGILMVAFLFLLPTMAAFADTIPNLLRNGIYFAMHKPLKTLVILFFDIFPLYLTYTDVQSQPLYAFVWFFFGFGALAMLGATLLLPEFKPYLPIVDACGDFILTAEGEKIMPGTEEEAIAMEEEGITEELSQSELEMLKEMEKMGM